MPHLNLTISPARLIDTEAVYRLEKLCFSDPTSRAKLAEYIQESLQRGKTPRRYVLVAEVPKVKESRKSAYYKEPYDIVGVIIFLVRAPKVVVQSVVVDPLWRRHGIGTELLKEALGMLHPDDGPYAAIGDVEGGNVACQLWLKACGVRAAWCWYRGRGVRQEEFVRFRASVGWEQAECAGV